MNGKGYIHDLGLIAPEVLLTLLSLVVLVWDLVKRGRDSRHLGYLTLAGLVAVGGLLLSQWQTLAAARGGALEERAFGMVTIDRFGTFFKLFTVGSLAVVSASGVVSCGDSVVPEHPVSASAMTPTPTAAE